ncbi:hypothetical protein DFH27DRAFT_11076 [Peziza echinospora]|nr:hypothetical protein DFH27DRAFT_11076 [Peziza echinospora]
MTRTKTNESAKESIQEKPFSILGDHIMPHRKEVAPQVADLEISRAEIAGPSKSRSFDTLSNGLGKDPTLLGVESRKDTDPALKDQLTDNPALDTPHTSDAIPEPQPAHVSLKGKEPEVGETYPEEYEAEPSAQTLAPGIEGDASYGSPSNFTTSLISVDVISEALRYMIVNGSQPLLSNAPAIVVSDESTTADGEPTTRNIVEVITPDIEDGELRRREPSRREHSRPSTRGSDMMSAKHQKNIMESFWHLVFVGWLGGFGKFFVGLFGRKK